jgi:restriction system protein
MTSSPKLPTFDDMMGPLIDVLRSLGGSGTIEEIFHKVVDHLKISDDQLSVLHDPEKGGMTEVEYRLAWTRTYLKKFGLIENSTRGVWALTTAGKQVEKLDQRKIVKTVRDMDRQEKKAETEEEVDVPISEDSWRSSLIETLMKMEPSAFERLIQRMLRECGFTQVQVTGRSGDGGIDGKGIMRIGGLMSFHVIFQCKRYKGTVSASQIRDFRGAMIGRADKGLFVTTGNFSKDAVLEATRDGATPLDMIDGDQLIEKLRELKLGVRTEIVQLEKISIDKAWFANI